MRGLPWCLCKTAASILQVRSPAQMKTERNSHTTILKVQSAHQVREAGQVAYLHRHRGQLAGAQAQALHRQGDSGLWGVNTRSEAASAHKSTGRCPKLSLTCLQWACTLHRRACSVGSDASAAIPSSKPTAESNWLSLRSCLRPTGRTRSRASVALRSRQYTATAGQAQKCAR